MQIRFFKVKTLFNNAFKFQSSFVSSSTVRERKRKHQGSSDREVGERDLGENTVIIYY